MPTNATNDTCRRQAAADVVEPGAPGRRRLVGRVPGPRPLPAGTRRKHRHPHPEDARDPLPILLGAYEKFGPIFTLRLLHTQVVFMLGPEANHFVTVSHPENFHWRESSFGDLIPLLGDGLLTIDEDYHDHARGTMMPAFHREQVAASVVAMIEEAGPAIELSTRARSSTSTSGCAVSRCGSRCGRCSASTPTRRAKARRRPSISSGPSGSTGSISPSASCAAPDRPGARCSPRARSSTRSSSRRSRSGEPGCRADGHPQPPAQRPRRVRRGFLGPRGPRPADDPDVRRSRHLDLDPDLHDVRARPPPRCDREAPGGAGRGAGRGTTPDIEKLEREMPYLDMVLDEVLRLYPPAWIGPRRAVRDFEFNGHTVPGGLTSTTAPGPATASRVLP